jgi:predicted transcriptional regulator
MSDKSVITVRPPKDSGLKERLLKAAEKVERSMNYIAVKAIEDYLKKQKSK